MPYPTVSIYALLLAKEPSRCGSRLDRRMGKKSSEASGLCCSFLVLNEGYHGFICMIGMVDIIIIV